MSSTRALNAKKTQEGDKQAIFFFNQFQQAREAPLYDQITEKYLETNFQELFEAFAAYMAEGVRKSRGAGNLSPTVKAGYFGKVVTNFRQRFIGNQKWLSYNETYFSTLRNQLEKKAKRLQIADANEAEDANIKALLVRVAAKDLWCPDRLMYTNAKNGGYAVDIESLCDRLMVRNEFNERLMVLVDAYAGGRGGEIANLRYRDMQWDDLYEMLDCLWIEDKTVNWYRVLMGGAPTDKFEIDILHAYAAVWIVDSTLLSDESEKDKNKADYVFHFKVKKAVATILSQMYKKHVAPNQAHQFSSKSTRKGTVSYLGWHPDITPAEANAIVGHAPVDNSRHYLKTNPKLSVRGNRALAGWSDVKGKKHPPTLSCLGPLAVPHHQHFIKHLYAIDHADFQPDGRLRTFLHCCTASVVMHYRQSKARLTAGNKLIRNIENAARSAKIECGSETDPLKVLQRWSETIEAEYITLNSETAPSKDVMEMIQAQQVSLSKFQSSDAEKGNMLRSMQDENAELRAKVESLSTDNAELKAGNAELKAGVEQILALLKTSGGDEAVAVSPVAASTRAAAEVLEPDSPTEASGPQQSKTAKFFNPRKRKAAPVSASKGGKRKAAPVSASKSNRKAAPVPVDGDQPTSSKVSVFDFLSSDVCQRAMRKSNETEQGPVRFCSKFATLNCLIDNEESKFLKFLQYLDRVVDGKLWFNYWQSCGDDLLKSDAIRAKRGIVDRVEKQLVSDIRRIDQVARERGERVPNRRTSPGPITILAIVQKLERFKILR